MQKGGLADCQEAGGEVRATPRLCRVMPQNANCGILTIRLANPSYFGGDFLTAAHAKMSGGTSISGSRTKRDAALRCAAYQVNRLLLTWERASRLHRFRSNRR